MNRLSSPNFKYSLLLRDEVTQRRVLTLLDVTILYTKPACLLFLLYSRSLLAFRTVVNTNCFSKGLFNCCSSDLSYLLWDKNLLFLSGVAKHMHWWTSKLGRDSWRKKNSVKAGTQRSKQSTGASFHLGDTANLVWNWVKGWRRQKTKSTVHQKQYV